MADAVCFGQPDLIYKRGHITLNDRRHVFRQSADHVMVCGVPELLEIWWGWKALTERTPRACARVRVQIHILSSIGRKTPFAPPQRAAVVWAARWVSAWHAELSFQTHGIGWWSNPPSSVER